MVGFTIQSLRGSGSDVGRHWVYDRKLDPFISGGYSNLSSEDKSPSPLASQLLPPSDGASLFNLGGGINGIVKLTKSSVAQPQEIAIGRHCEHDA